MAGWGKLEQMTRGRLKWVFQPDKVDEGSHSTDDIVMVLPRPKLIPCTSKRSVRYQFPCDLSAYGVK